MNAQERKIYNKLAAAIKNSGLSQREVGRRSGLSSGAVHRIIKQKKLPNVVTLVMIADGLGVDIDSFFKKD